MTDLLRDPRPRVGLDKPPLDVRAAARALYAGTATAAQQQRIYRFIVHELCGVSNIALTLPAEESVANWRLGSLYVGQYLEAARLMPEADPPPTEAPARTMTEKARRRTRSTAQG